MKELEIKMSQELIWLVEFWKAYDKAAFESMGVPKDKIGTSNKQ